MGRLAVGWLAGVCFGNAAAAAAGYGYRYDALVMGDLGETGRTRGRVKRGTYRIVRN